MRYIILTNKISNTDNYDCVQPNLSFTIIIRKIDTYLKFLNCFCQIPTNNKVYNIKYLLYYYHYDDYFHSY